MKFILPDPLKKIRESRNWIQESTEWNPESKNGFHNFGRIIWRVVKHSGSFRVSPSHYRMKNLRSSIAFARIYSQDSDSYNRLCYPLFEQSSWQNIKRYISKLDKISKDIPPNLAAISRTAKTSFNPPIRQLSIWQNCNPLTCKNCLKITRFWQCSPVATPIPKGWSFLEISACPGKMIQRRAGHTERQTNVTSRRPYWKGHHRFGGRRDAERGLESRRDVG